MLPISLGTVPYSRLPSRFLRHRERIVIYDRMKVTRYEGTSRCDVIFDTFKGDRSAQFGQIGEPRDLGRNGSREEVARKPQRPQVLLITDLRGEH